MTEKYKRGQNPRSLSNLGRGRTGKGAVRKNYTVRPETAEWLASTGNASETIDQLVAEKIMTIKPLRRTDKLTGDYVELVTIKHFDVDDSYQFKMAWVTGGTPLESTYRTGAGRAGLYMETTEGWTQVKGNSQFYVPVATSHHYILSYFARGILDLD